MKRMKEEAHLLNLGYHIGRIHNGIRKNASDYAAKVGFEYRFELMIVLRILYKYGEPMPQSMILEFLPILDKHRLSRMCAELEEQNLISRVPNPENRRENILDLTPKGIETIEEFKKIIQAANPNVFDDITPDHLEIFFQSLSKILHNLER